MVSSNLAVRISNENGARAAPFLCKSECAIVPSLLAEEARTVSLRGAEQVQPENRLETQNRHDLLMEAIAGLPREQREAFLLKEEAGLTVEEIAVTTGVTHEAAKSRLRYAISKLRAQLESVHEH